MISIGIGLNKVSITSTTGEEYRYGDTSEHASSRPIGDKRQQQTAGERPKRAAKSMTSPPSRRSPPPRPARARTPAREAGVGSIARFGSFAYRRWGIGKNYSNMVLANGTACHRQVLVEK
ncbi:hypothetical protein Aduo_017422 [Ancylostoma duodenale]